MRCCDRLLRTPAGKLVTATLLLLGSYLAAGLMNAAPIVQPKLSGPYARRALVLVVPDAATAQTPATPPVRRPLIESARSAL